MKISHFVSRLRNTGFFSIVISGMLNKAITFLSGVILVRVLSREDYGAYSYALNIISYFLLVNGLGTSNCVVQFCVEQSDQEHAERMYSLASSIGVFWDILLCLVIFFVGLFVPLSIQGSNGLFLLFAPLPLSMFVVDMQQQRLRSQFRNSEYALATNINSVIVVVFSVLGALIASSLGLTIARTLAMVVTFVAVYFFFHVKIYCQPIHEPMSIVIDMLKMSLTACSAAAISQMLMLSGTTLIGLSMSDESAVAAYSTASTIPFALAFLPTMITTYSAPYFVQYAHDRSRTLRMWGICTAGAFALCLVVGVVLIAFAPWLIPAVFGAQYSDCIPAFIVLMIGFVIGQPLRGVAMSVLGSHRKYVFNLLTNIASLIACIGLTIPLLPKFGIIAAATGYLLSMVVGSVVSVFGVLVYAGHPNSQVLVDSDDRN